MHTYWYWWELNCFFPINPHLSPYHIPPSVIGTMFKNLNTSPLNPTPSSFCLSSRCLAPSTCCLFCLEPFCLHPLLSSAAYIYALQLMPQMPSLSGNIPNYYPNQPWSLQLFRESFLWIPIAHCVCPNWTLFTHGLVMCTYSSASKFLEDRDPIF